MIVSFFGHRDFVPDDDIKNALLSTLIYEIREEPVDFYLGHYGFFDTFALKCCLTYKELNQKANLLFITPYLDPEYLKNKKTMLSKYDGIIYPDCDLGMKKYAIVHRNEWMVNHSDLIIAYLDHGWGGTLHAIRYALTKRKRVINFGKYSI